MDILVVLEENYGSLHRLSKEAIAGAQELGGEVVALAIGQHANEIADELSSFDLTDVITVDHEMVATYNADGYSEVIKKIIEAESPKIIVAGHTYQTRDFMPRVSAGLHIPFILDIVSLSDSGFVKQVLNAKLNATASSNSDQVILSFQSAAFSEENIRPGSCSYRSFDIKLDSTIVRSISEEPFQEAAGDVDLDSADLLVSVGRGIEKEENVHLAFELAEALGAEVSASRPVVDSGWIDSFRQVGSSGSNVAPKLYFSL